MSANIIIANVIGFVSYTISIIAYHRKKKKNIFIDTLLSNILKLIQYMILGAYSGTMTKVMAIVRDVTIIKQEKYKFLNSILVLMIFVTAYIMLGILTYQGVMSMFSIMAALIYTILCWNGDENKVRRTVIIAETLWLIYNAYVKLYSGCLFNTLMIISTIIAIYINRRERRTTKWKKN